MLHDWKDRFSVSANVNYADMVDSIRAARERVHEGLGKCFVTWQTKKPTFATCLEEEMASWGPSILQIYINWIKQRIEMEQGTGPLDFEAYMPPRCAGLIVGIAHIFEQAGLSEPDSVSKTAEF